MSLHSLALISSSPIGEGPNFRLDTDAQSAALESNGNFQGGHNANDSLGDDCDTWTAAYELCGHQYRPDNGRATGFGSNRQASRWAPAWQSLKRNTGLRVG
jgi:hypothetical protein